MAEAYLSSDYLRPVQATRVEFWTVGEARALGPEGKITVASHYLAHLRPQQRPSSARCYLDGGRDARARGADFMSSIMR
jgi:hypothetical protein